MIPQDIIDRYQSGGDIWVKLAAQYGEYAANKIASAAATGQRDKLTEAIASVRNGAAMDTSVSSILLDQLLTNPLDAPLSVLDSGFARLFDSSGIKTILVLSALTIVFVMVLKSNK